MAKQDKFITNILNTLDNVSASDWEMYINETNLSTYNPKNLFTEKAYQGFNSLVLYIDILLNKRKSDLYATFNSIKKAGGILQKGAKGVCIEYFTFVFYNPDTRKKLKKDDFLKLDREEQLKFTRYSVVKYYYVFNSDYIVNLDELNVNTVNTVREELEKEEAEFIEQENCEQFYNSLIDKGELKLLYEKINVAFYNLKKDTIYLPEKKYFKNEKMFYSTLFHELIHWTGAESRLNRNLENRANYSFEELIAEMGSMLLCLQFGIVEEITNSIRYLKGWVSKVKDDKEKTLKSAFFQSKRAKKYLEALA